MNHREKGRVVGEREASMREGNTDQLPPTRTPTRYRTDNKYVPHLESNPQPFFM